MSPKTRRTLIAVACAALIAPALAVPSQARAASADVAALQVAIRALGLYPHLIDGITGPWTRHGVKRFQHRHGLAVNGIAGPKTRKALGRRGRPPLGSRPMRRGKRGWDVAALQFLLRSRGFGQGGLDGGFGQGCGAACAGRASWELRKRRGARRPGERGGRVERRLVAATPGGGEEEPVACAADHGASIMRRAALGARTRDALIHLAERPARIRGDGGHEAAPFVVEPEPEVGQEHHRTPAKPVRIAPSSGEQMNCISAQTVPNDP